MGGTASSLAAQQFQRSAQPSPALNLGMQPVAAGVYHHEDAMVCRTLAESVSRTCTATLGAAIARLDGRVFDTVEAFVQAGGSVGRARTPSGSTAARQPAGWSRPSGPWACV